MIKFYWYAEGPYEAKHQFLINRWETTGLSDSKAFIEHSKDIDDIYKDI